MALDEDCIFCKIIQKQIPATVLFEDDRVLAFADINPQAPVHALIIPKEHVDRAHHLTSGHGEVLAAMFAAGRAVAEDKRLVESGYRLVINNGEGAGQAVFHLHMHLLGGRPLSWPPG